MINILAYNDGIANIPGTNIHIYSILLTVGFLVALIASWIKLNRRNIPTRTLEWGALIIVFVGVIGARLWYIINDTAKVKSFIDVVAVWNGGMAIQGGITCGIVAGFIIFYRASKRLEISMWVFIDCIIPNILLGQAIGRWGNFFNQELLGANVGHPFWWLPSWMNNHLHYGLWVDNRDPVEVYRQPLFLYESVLSLLGWIILTFFVPKVGQMVSKKPWKLFPEQFVSPLVTQPVGWKDFLIPWKLVKKLYGYHKFKQEAWKTAYFDFAVDNNKVKNIHKKPWQPSTVNSQNNYKLVAIFKKKYAKLKYNMQPHAAPLHNILNPNQYRVTYSGVAGSLYFVFYGIIRMILEPLRDSRDIMMINGVRTSMILSALWIVGGLVAVIFAQVLAPTRFRKGGWLYEKSY